MQKIELKQLWKQIEGQPTMLIWDVRPNIKSISKTKCLWRRDECFKKDNLIRVSIANIKLGDNDALFFLPELDFRIEARRLQVFNIYGPWPYIAAYHTVFM